MKSRLPHSCLGYSALVGGAFGLLLAPVMVTVKYMTGWAIIAEPFWVDSFQRALRTMFQTATPPELWMAFGTAYTIAMLLMFAGLLGLSGQLRDTRGRVRTSGYWILLAGFSIVIPGDAIHTWTWSQNGLTVPTPGTNPVANTAYAVHMIGVICILTGSMIMGVSALRKKFLSPWLGWSLILILPSAVLASTTQLPTTPSGALWLFSILMMICGYLVVTGRTRRIHPS